MESESSPEFSFLCLRQEIFVCQAEEILQEIACCLWESFVFFLLVEIF